MIREDALSALGDPWCDSSPDEIAACGMPRDLHDELDRLVADAYGWPWPMETDEILARLVALHDERIEEEQRGLVRWLRPDYQVPRFGDKVEGGLTLDVLPDEDDDDIPADLPDWPSDPLEQLAPACLPRTFRPFYPGSIGGSGGTSPALRTVTSGTPPRAIGLPIGRRSQSVTP